MPFHLTRRVVICLGVALGLGCSPGGSDGGDLGGWPNRPGPKVVAGFAPLYSLAASIGGDDANVICLSGSTGPHGGGDPSPDQIRLIRKADLILGVGLGLDERHNGRLREVAHSPKWNLVELGEKLDPKTLLEGACLHDHGPGQSHEGHDHGTDPHVWLSPDYVRVMAGEIRDEFSRLDPAHAKNYADRAEALLKEVGEVEQYGRDKFKNLKDKTIVSHHDALQYFARAFGLTVAAPIQQAEIEPNSDELAKVKQICLAKKVRVIAVEPQFSANTSAKSLLSSLKSAGIDAVMVEVDPIETADAAALKPGLWQAVMRRNIDKLAEALK